MIAEVVAGRFEVLDLAGSGGMGRVYRARDRVTGELAALKVLRSETVERARFTRESALLAELRHPGIVRYVAHGETPSGEPYLAMEWLGGEDLAHRLRRRPMSPVEAVKLGLRVGEALEAAHRRGIVHRDIKPANLFLPDGSVERAKIIDFGIARSSGLAAGLTVTGAMIGTPSYMAPEQARGQKDVGPQADVFSLGCVLYRCLTGRPPFVGDDALAVLLKLAVEDAPRARTVRGDIPPALDDALARMLARSPADRPPSAGAAVSLLAALRDLSHEPAPADSVPSVVSGVEQRLVGLLVARATPDLDDSSAPASGTGTDARGAGDLDLAGIVERHGGKLHRVADGSLLVTLPGGVAATDHAVKVARCALAVRSRLRGAAVAAVAGRAVLEGPVPMGALIDRGVALSGRQRTAGIRIDAHIAGLLDGRFDVTRDAEGAVLHGEVDRAAGARTLLGAPSRYVGRDREVLRLLSVLDEHLAEPAARAVLVTAPAGMGKSRLRHELVRRLRQDEPYRAVRIWTAQGDPMSAGSPFALVVSLLRGAPDTPSREGAAALLEELLAPVSPARVDPGGLRDRVSPRFLDWLRGEAAAGPVMLVVDDLHWGDPPSISLLDTALRDLADLPLLILSLARPEVHEVLPGALRERLMFEVKLGPLSRRSAEQMVRAALGDSAPADVVSAVVSRGAGNAFHLEELIRAVSEGRGDTLPETVLAMAEARLERLGPEARRVLRAASIFGETFWKGGVTALLGALPGETGDMLDHLVGCETIERRGSARYAGDEEYRFRHALVRDAAYAMLTDGDRAQGHARAAEYLERAGEQDASVLAEHFRRGGSRDRAARGFQRAALQALAGGDLAATLTRVEQAIACGAAGKQLGELRLLEGEVHMWRGEPALAARRWDEARAELPAGSIFWWFAIVGAFTTRSFGDMAEAGELLREARALELPPDTCAHDVSRLAIAVQALGFAGLLGPAQLFVDKLERLATRGDPGVRGWHRWASSVLARYRGADPWQHYRSAREAAEDPHLDGDHFGELYLKADVALALTDLGALDEAERLLWETHRAARDVGAHFVTAAIELCLATVLMSAGRLGESKRLIEQASGVLVEGRLLSGASHFALAQVLLFEGDGEGALREAEAMTTPGAAGTVWTALACAVRAQVLLARNEAGALAWIEEAQGILAELGWMAPGIGEVLSFARAQALFSAGQVEAGRREIAVATGRILRNAEGILDADLRGSYLEKRPENMVLLGWAAAAGVAAERG